MFCIEFSTKVAISFLKKPASCFFSFIWYISPSLLLLIPPQKTCRTQIKQTKKIGSESHVHLTLSSRKKYRFVSSRELDVG